MCVLLGGTGFAKAVKLRRALAQVNAERGSAGAVADGIERRYVKEVFHVGVFFAVSSRE